MVAARKAYEDEKGATWSGSQMKGAHGGSTWSEGQDTFGSQGLCHLYYIYAQKLVFQRA